MAPSESPSSRATAWSWTLGTKLPTSYRVALVLGLIVFSITLVSLCVLTIYIRQQYRFRLLLEAVPSEEDDRRNRYFRLGQRASTASDEDWESLHEKPAAAPRDKRRPKPQTLPSTSLITVG
ncbi:unnamed protein product [Blumeria hordei]|uniref:Uncharacterized protein n=1 Tax=Blumeria hordei TaxID=2867405 RepID=A0A383UX04_BLUHO|nr:unnamed protein product [Blumeria hordei]